MRPVVPDLGEPSPDETDARVRADERARCAKELHDTIGQALVAASFEAARVVRHAEAGRDTVKALAEALAAQLEAAIALSRRTQTAWLASSDGAGPAEGLARALAGRAEAVARRAGIAIRVDVDVDDRRLDSAVARAAVQCATAALDNVARHARATHAAASARLDEGGLEIVVEDDGRGADPLGVGAPTATGFLGMRARTAAHGGAVAVERRPGGGTRVVLTFPAAFRREGSR